MRCYKNWQCRINDLIYFAFGIGRVKSFLFLKKIIYRYFLIQLAQ